MAEENRKGRPRWRSHSTTSGVARHQPAHHAEGFRQRADFNVDLAMQAKVVHDAAPALAQHALAVGVIDHQDGLIILADGVDLVQRGDIAIHAEDPVGDHHGARVSAALLLQHPLAGQPGCSARSG